MVLRITVVVTSVFITFSKHSILVRAFNIPWNVFIKDNSRVYFNTQKDIFHTVSTKFEKIRNILDYTRSFTYPYRESIAVVFTEKT